VLASLRADKPHYFAHTEGGAHTSATLRYGLFGAWNVSTPSGAQSFLELVSAGDSIPFPAKLSVTNGQGKNERLHGICVKFWTKAVETVEGQRLLETHSAMLAADILSTRSLVLHGGDALDTFTAFVLPFLAERLPLLAGPILTKSLRVASVIHDENFAARPSQQAPDDVQQLMNELRFLAVRAVIPFDPEAIFKVMRPFMGLVVMPDAPDNPANLRQLVCVMRRRVRISCEGGDISAAQRREGERLLDLLEAGGDMASRAVADDVERVLASNADVNVPLSAGREAVVAAMRVRGLFPPKKPPHDATLREAAMVRRIHTAADALRGLLLRSTSSAAARGVMAVLNHAGGIQTGGAIGGPMMVALLAEGEAVCDEKGEDAEALARAYSGLDAGFYALSATAGASVAEQRAAKGACKLAFLRRHVLLAEAEAVGRGALARLHWILAIACGQFGGAIGVGLRAEGEAVCDEKGEDAEVLARPYSRLDAGFYAPSAPAGASVVERRAAKRASVSAAAKRGAALAEAMDTGGQGALARLHFILAIACTQFGGAILAAAGAARRQAGPAPERIAAAGGETAVERALAATLDRKAAWAAKKALNNTAKMEQMQAKGAEGDVGAESDGEGHAPRHSRSGEGATGAKKFNKAS